MVSKLLEIITPDKVYFGEKDFQQLVIIRQLIKILNINVDIIPCQTIREKCGLAMSSRNKLLSKEQKKSATLISKTLFEAQKLTNKMPVYKLKKWVIEKINSNKLLDVQYFEIVDDEKLIPITSWDEKTQKIGCIAINIGKIRLIDNVRFYS